MEGAEAGERVWRGRSASKIIAAHARRTLLHHAPGIQHLALSTWHLALGTWHLALGTWHLALGTWHLALGTWHLALGTYVQPVARRAERPYLLQHGIALR